MVKNSSPADGLDTVQRIDEVLKRTRGRAIVFDKSKYGSYARQCEFLAPHIFFLTLKNEDSTEDFFHMLYKTLCFASCLLDEKRRATNRIRHSSSSPRSKELP